MRPKEMCVKNSKNLKPKRGKKILLGKGWRLTGPNKRYFKGSVIAKFRVSKETVLVVRVIERPDRS